MLKEKLTEAEAWLALILASPALSAEFFFIDEKNEPFKLWDFQMELFESEAQKELVFCARKTSKSTTIVARLFSFPFRKPGRRAFLTSAQSFHLDTITSELEKQIRNSYIHRNFLKLRFRPYFVAKAANNALIFSRVPQKKGAGVKSIHADEVYADEYQDFTEKAKAELNEVFQAVGRRFLSGVPDITSMRLARMLLGETNYKIFRFPRMYNPTWNDQVRKDKIDEYGSEDDFDYLRNIWGIIPEEIQAVFPKRYLYASTEKDKNSRVNTEFVYQKLYANESPVEGLQLTPKFTQIETYFFGIDLGWGLTAPTLIQIWGYDTGFNKYRLLAYYSFNKYKPEEIKQIYLQLTRYYQPRVVGIDATGGGFTLFNLLNSVYPATEVDFAQKTKISFVSQNSEGETEVITKDVFLNDLSVEYARDFIINEKIVLPQNKEIFAEFASFSRSTSGNRIVYTKGLHGVDAFRVFVTALNLKGIEGSDDSDNYIIKPQFHTRR